MSPGRFEVLLNAPEPALATAFQRVTVDPRRDPVEGTVLLARSFGLNPAQLTCALGFNPNTGLVPRVMAVLGYSNFEALQARASYLFINDCYRNLSIDNILDVYAAVAALAGAASWAADMALSRLAYIEQQIEETINPVMIGGYKLEMRALYDKGIANRDFVEARLRDGDTVLRGIANEAELMVISGLVEPARLMLGDLLSLDERRRLLTLKLVPVEVIAQRLDRTDLSDSERALLESVKPD